MRRTSKWLAVIISVFYTLNVAAQKGDKLIAAPDTLKERVTHAADFEFGLSAVDDALNASYLKLGKDPEFPGGMKALLAFAQRNLYYPPEAIDANARGSVMLQFVINKKGEMIDPKVLKGVHPSLDKICLAMLHKMPLWEPATLFGKPVVVKFRWQIRFVLQD